MGWSLPGVWAQINVWQADTIIVPPIAGVVVGPAISLPEPNALVGATNFGDPGAVALIYHHNPGPYSDEVVFMLRTWFGQRLFGEKMPSPQIGGEFLGRFDTLVEVSGFALNTVPLGNDLMGSIGSSERMRGTVVLDNRDRSWSQRVMTEPLLCMPSGLWRHFGGGTCHLDAQGQVERIVITAGTTTVEVSEP